MGFRCQDGCWVPGSPPWLATGCNEQRLLRASVSPSHLSAVFCRVYMPDHSYVTIRSRLSASVQDILASVTEKLQYSEEQSAREDALILVTVASSGGARGAGEVLRAGVGREQPGC